MKFLLALFATLFFALPAWAVDITMGANGNLIFDPADVTISAGDTVHFVNGMLPPHNVIVEDHPELSHGDLAFAPGFHVKICHFFRINRERISPFDRRASESCRQFDRPHQLTFADNVRDGRSSTRLFNGGMDL